MKKFIIIFILLFVGSSITFAKVNILNFGRNWTIEGYDGPKNRYSYDLSGAGIHYKGKLIYNFSDCQGSGSTTNKINIDDFCGMSFSQIKSGKNGLYFEITADHPGSVYESGIYILDVDGRFLLQSGLFSYQKCLIEKNGIFTEKNDCKYLGYKVLSNGNISVNYNIRGKIQTKVIVASTK